MTVYTFPADLVEELCGERLCENLKELPFPLDDYAEFSVSWPYSAQRIEHTRHWLSMNISAVASDNTIAKTGDRS